MRTRYDSLDLGFRMDGYSIRALNIVFEQFTRAIPKHSHSEGSYELHYIPYGSGKVVIDGTHYEVSENTLYVTGPHVEHEQFPDSDNPMAEYCIYLRIEKEHSSSTTGKIARTDLHTHVMKEFLKTPFWFGSDTQSLRPLMQLLFAELESHQIGYIIEVESLLKQCIVRMVRNYQAHGENLVAVSPTPNLFNSKSIILEECFLYEYNTLTLEILANRLALSRRQTERLLKDQYGKTFGQKRTEARMSAATVLLRNSDQSISEISELLGYSSIEHFSNAFRKYWDISPSVFRAKYRISTSNS